MHRFCYFHLPNTIDRMIKSVDITLKDRSQNQEEEKEGTAYIENQDY